MGTNDSRRGCRAGKALHPATAGDLVEHQRGGHRGIEARGGAPQRNPDQLITGAPGEQGEPRALGARDHDEGAIEISLVQAHGSLLGQADHPVALLLEGVEGAVEVDDPGDGEMLQGTGSHLGHGAGEAGGAALGEHQTMGPEGFGTADDGTEVVGIGEAIHGHQQRRLPEIPTAIHQGGQIKGFSRGGLKDDALVNGTTGDLAKAGPGDLLHQHPTRFRLPKQLQELGGKAHLRGAPDPVDRPAALEGGKGRMTPPDQIVGGRLAKPIGFRWGLHDRFSRGRTVEGA